MTRNVATVLLAALLAGCGGPRVQEVSPAAIDGAIQTAELQLEQAQKVSATRGEASPPQASAPQPGFGP